MQVTAERVVRDAHVAPLGGGGELVRLELGNLVVAGAVGQVEVYADHRRERLGDVGEVLHGEHHDQLGAVVEVAVEVPPLVGAGLAVGPCAVFPGCDFVGADTDPRVVLGCGAEPRQ